ncbi:hypothetical protein [Kitasatospora sp. GP82]|uniref:SCO2583 family membrane protein n=1 Tax=Kitasatospora sp. GP82 TaxID=3035089 RepID=UPI002474C292|nr:hypothetical protein [Kitasatospora sp. GP82]MDH6125177.1 hypothetical protein [Kitasatospora sp. GP82]
MGDPREPPEGTPDGGSGNDDEYRSVVFDESFVRAARIQELSASERLGGYSRGVRPRLGFGHFGSLPRQAVALLLLVAMAFAAAVYFGVSSPRRLGVQPTGNQLTVSVVALGPSSPVLAVADPKSPFAALPPGYSDGAAGLATPAAAATAHFSRVEVTRALDTVQRYLIASSLSQAALVQGQTGDVRSLVTPGEQAQYDQSLNSPSDDQHHVAVGWLVRFDPGKVELAADTVKVSGSMRVTEADSATLEIATDHTFVYALRPAGTDTSAPVSLFSVRRELRFEFDHTDIGAARVRLVDSVLQDGPAGCGVQQADHLQPLLPGQAAGTPPVVNPADHSVPAWQLCGVLGPITTSQ